MIVSKGVLVVGRDYVPERALVADAGRAALLALRKRYASTVLAGKPTGYPLGCRWVSP
jgi:hypothetical protein